MLRAIQPAPAMRDASFGHAPGLVIPENLSLPFTNPISGNYLSHQPYESHDSLDPELALLPNLTDHEPHQISGLPLSPILNHASQDAWPLHHANGSPEQYRFSHLPLIREFNHVDRSVGYQIELDTTLASSPVSPKPFNCTVQGCNSKGFMRKYELERHMKKHNRAQVFPCPVGGCQFSQPTKAFYRRDKLQSHLQNVHPGYQAANTGTSAAGPATGGPAVTSG